MLFFILFFLTDQVEDLGVVIHAAELVCTLTTGVEVHHGTGVGVGGMIHTRLVVDGVADGHTEGDVGAIQLIILLAHLALAGRANLEGYSCPS